MHSGEISVIGNLGLNKQEKTEKKKYFYMSISDILEER